MINHHIFIFHSLDELPVVKAHPSHEWRKHPKQKNP